MNDQDAKELFINPYYAIQISPLLVSEHKMMTSKKKWVQVNAKLMDEIGKEAWLKQLLEILESGEQRHSIKKRSI